MDSVTICNLALGMLGMPHITSPEETNNNALLCRKFYPVLRDRVLRDHAWSFATTAKTPSVLDEEGFDPEFPVVCTIPNDAIRVLRLIPDLPYLRRGRQIHTTARPEKIVYTRRVDDPSLFDETFVEALQYLLASELARSNTRDAQLAGSLRAEYERRLAVARSIDSQENFAAYQNAPRRSNWLSGRMSDRRCTPVKWTEGNAGRQGE